MVNQNFLNILYMVLTLLCPPALIYLMFSITQIVIDTFQHKYNLAMMKLWVSFVITILMQFLCKSGLGIISWLLVFLPFILMSLIVGILLAVFGLDPRTGKLILDEKDKTPSPSSISSKHHLFNDNSEGELEDNMVYNIKIMRKGRKCRGLCKNSKGEDIWQ